MVKENAAYDNLPAKQSRWDMASQRLASRQQTTQHQSERSSRLTDPINRTLGSLRHWLVSFRQKFGKNGKVLHRILRTFRVGLNIDNVGRRMPSKILLESAPSPRQYPAAGIETGDRSAEDITCEWKGCDVAAGRTSVGIEVDFWGLTPDENPVGSG